MLQKKLQSAMELTTKTITLKATDYKENDKLILLYSLEYGKILATAKGMRKPTAKLKFVSQPFSFCQVELNQTHGYLTLKTAEQLESFFTLGDDIENYLAGCVVLDCLATLEGEENPNSQLFVEVLNALKALSTQNQCGRKIALHFLLKYLTNAGLVPNFSSCLVCGEKSPKQCFLDFSHNGIVCQNCRTANSIQLAKSSATVIPLVSSSTYTKLKNLNIPDNQLKECLEVLDSFITHSVSKIKSISQLVKI